MRPASADSLRIELLRHDDEGFVAVYRGDAVDRAGAACPLEVCLVDDPAAPGKLAAEVVASTDDEALRGPLERTVAVMVTSAVRTARREGRPPPRRVRRWRSRGDLR